MASNQEQAIRDAATPQDAAKAYQAYCTSMQNAGQTPKPIDDLL